MSNTKENVSQRYRQILQYLVEHKSASRPELAAAISISLTRLSEDLSTLIDLGYPIIAPPKKPVMLDETKPLPNFREPITRSVIRQWILLYLLNQSKYPLTRSELFKKYHELSFGYEKAWQSYGEETFHYDFNDLLDLKFVVPSGNHTYKLSETAPVIFLLTDDRLIKFVDTYHLYAQFRPIQSAISDFYKKAAYILGDTDSDTPQTAFFHGRSNFISEKMESQLQEFRTYNYQQKQLSFTYQTNTKGLRSCTFSTALLIYSMDKNRFYLLGEADSEKILVPIDRIDLSTITELDEENKIYHSPLYRDIISQIFSMSNGDPINVRVRFPNIYNIQSKLLNLCEMRKASGAHIHTEGNDLIYHDTIRGLSDFKKYLRRFGRSALVEEPQVLKDEMMESARLTLECYVNPSNSASLMQPAASAVPSAPEPQADSPIIRFSNILSLLCANGITPSIQEISRELDLPIGQIRRDMVQILKAKELQQIILEGISDNIPLGDPDSPDSKTFFKDLLKGKYDTEPFSFAPEKLEIPKDNYLFQCTPMEHILLTQTFPHLFLKKLSDFDDCFIKESPLAPSSPFTDSEDQPLEDILLTISHAINVEYMIKFQYKPQRAPEYTEYTISPIAIYHNTENNYIYCISSENRQLFLLDRMRDVKLTDPAHPIPLTQEELQIISCSWGALKFNQKPIHVKLEIGKTVANTLNKIKAETAHRIHGKHYEADGKYYYEDDIIGEENFRSWVRSYGSSMTILEPKFLADKMIDTEQRKLLQYIHNRFLSDDEFEQLKATTDFDNL